mgnify:CR=1 FL=1
MSFLKNYTFLFGSVTVVLGSVAWGLAEGGYEPWIVATAGFLGIFTNWELVPKFGTRRRSLTPTEKLAARDKWRPIFNDYFLEAARKNYRGDAIVHDVDRLDNYPDAGDEKSISSWFRVGLMGTYNDGILLGLRWTKIEEENGIWVENYQSEAAGGVKVMLLGEVPFESIESVNFEGDDFYNKPHIFCHFDFEGEPYKRLFYGEEFQLDPKFPCHYRDLLGYERKKPSRLRFWG